MYEKPQSAADIRLAILGAGKMGGALLRGWIAAEIVAPEQVAVFNRRPESTAKIAAETGARAASDAADALRDANILLIAVKPHLVGPVLAPLRDRVPTGCLVLSVAAGVHIATMEAALPPQTPVVRVIPNTPSAIGAGAAAFCRGANVTDADAALVTRLFEAVGRVVEVIAEEQIDAALGVSSSGVAYLYLLIEALIDGGVRAGLPRDAARILAAQTALGAARMLLETDAHPGTLKDAVTTPGGTTIAGLHKLESAGVRGTLIDAVLAARDRARELG